MPSPSPNSMWIGSAVGMTAPVALVLAASVDAGHRTRASVEAAGCHAMICCNPAIALDWLIEHEGFFACVVVEPELADARCLAGLLDGARETGLEVPFLVRTAFPFAGSAFDEMPASGGYPSVRRIPVGCSALEASLRALCSGAEPARPTGPYKAWGS